jgi:hypothetical protein
MNPRLRWSLLVPFAAIVAGMGSTAVAQTPMPPEASPPTTDIPPPPPPPPVDTAPPAAAYTVPPPVDAIVPPPAPPPPAPPPKTPQAPLKIETPNGSSIKFGFLAQPQFEAVGSPTLDKYAYNMFIRRTRILVGGSLFGVVDYFFDTDFPNLFKATPVAGAMGGANTSVKATPGMNIQDAFVTYKAMGDMLKVDVGYMLPPMSHNAIQGAATLYGWDYFAYTFQHANSFGSSAPGPVGRDMGIELRGLVIGGHLEYRLGLFQGLRNGASATEQASRNFFRAMARVQINLLDAEPGFFYAGTYFGAKKIASIGGSYDFQDDYKYFSVDGILDLPAGPGVVTAQVNLAQWDGSGFIALPKQTAIMGEAGYNIAAVQISPIVRVEHISGNSPVVTTNRYALGIAYWPYNHNTNLKAFFTRISPDGQDDFNQFNLQWQVYFF